LLALCSTSYAQEEPTDCFQVSKNYYGDSDLGDLVNNFDDVTKLGKDHVLTEVKGCTDNNSKAKGVQLTYGVWNNGAVTDKVELTSFGDVSGRDKPCTSLSIGEDERIKSVLINYSTYVEAIAFITDKGQFQVVGTSTSSRSSEKAYSFTGDFDFFGLVGTETKQISSVSIIRFKTECLNDFKASMGSDFTYGGDGYQAPSGSSSSSSTTSGSTSNQSSNSSDDDFDDERDSESGSGIELDII